MHALTRLCLARPTAAAAAIAVTTLVLGAGTARLHSEFGYRVLIGEDHPAVRRLEAIIEQFGGGLPLWVVWECGAGRPCESVFDPASLAMADAVVRELSPHAATRAVYAPSNAPVLVPEAGGFAVRRLVEEGDPVPDAAALARFALDDPLWRGRLVSPDGAIGAIAVQPVDSSDAAARAVVDATAAALAPHEAAGFRFHWIGDPAVTVVAGRELADSMGAIVPFCALLIAGVIAFLFQSLRAALFVMLTMGTALIWTFGTLGWLGWPRDGILEVLAPLVLIVGVCDAVHLLARAAARAEEGVDRESARVLLAAARDVGPPCAITSLTTAAALLSFATSPLESFVRFGVISAFGVMACWLLTFSLLPILSLALPPTELRHSRVSSAWRRRTGAIVGIAQRHAAAILLASAAAAAVFGAGWWLRLRVDTDWNQTFGESSQVVRWRRAVEGRLRESTTYELRITLPLEWPLESPETLRRVGALAQRLETTPGLGPATSVVDLLRRLNRLVHDDDPRFERIAPTRSANAQLLELLSLQDADVLSGWVSLDRRALRVSVEAPETAYVARAAVLAAAAEHVRRELPGEWQVDASGAFAINQDWVRDVQATQLRSFPAALLLVWALAAVFLRSALLALVAVIPPLLAVVVTLGSMGFAGMTLDVGRAMVAAIVLGIGVDDGLHLLDRHRRLVRRGLPAPRAMREALRHTGRALVTTSVALSLGFLTLTESAWQTISSFGLCVALAIATALLATLFVIPALVFVTSGVKTTSNGRREERPGPGPPGLPRGVPEPERERRASVKARLG